MRDIDSRFRGNDSGAGKTTGVEMTVETGITM